MIEFYKAITKLRYHQNMREIMSKTIEQKIEELAIELWAVMDPLGTTKWRKLSQKNQDFYKSRARHFMSMGWKKPPVVEAGEGVVDIPDSAIAFSCKCGQRYAIERDRN